jgi:ABC-2 type transport system ATP-binding protein
MTGALTARNAAKIAPDTIQIFALTRPCAEFSSMLKKAMDAAISTSGLTRRFGDFVAVQNVNLSVAPGQFFGFLGPNGAGKSTTIKMLTGLLAPTSGSIQVLGMDFATHAIEVKRQIGVVPEGLALFGRLTASEYLRFVGQMYGLDRATTLQRSEELLEFMSLAGETKKLITDFSHGMQKKLALAAAVIHGPKILFLDEPFEGVDAIAAGTLKQMLQGMIARGATIFLTSHVLEIVERLCTHVAIINRGELIANGSLEELRAGVHTQADSDNAAARLTLEEIFIRVIGKEDGSENAQSEQELSWLG